MSVSGDIMDRILNPFTDCFTPEVARNVANLRADSATQAQLDDLAKKANEGKLTPDEQALYDRFLDAFHFVTVVQSKAREYLRRQSSS